MVCVAGGRDRQRQRQRDCQKSHQLEFKKKTVQDIKANLWVPECLQAESRLRRMLTKTLRSSLFDWFPSPPPTLVRIPPIFDI